METPSLLLVCVLLTCAVWTVSGRMLEAGGEEQLDGEASAQVGKFPGVCWACKWALNKVKKATGDKATSEKLKSALLSICNEIGLLKSVCRKFVKTHIGQLIEELSTTDDVKTICINTRACKRKEIADLLFYPYEESMENE